MFILSCILLTFGCNNSFDLYDSQEASGNDKNYDICIYTAKNETTEVLNELCKKYWDETGVKVKVVSASINEDYFEQLKKELNSSKKPAVFAVHGFSELSELRGRGEITDLSLSKNSSLSEISKKVPENLKLGFNENESFGIPYGFEGYGYIVDHELIAALFGDENVEPFISNLRLSSFEEFENLVKSTDAYIKNPTPAEIILNGVAFTFNYEKTGKAMSLKGVFSIPGCERSYIDQTINTALSTVFEKQSNIINISDEQINTFSQSLLQSIRELDLVTTYAFYKENQEGRSAAFTDKSINNYKGSVQNFVGGKTLFLRNIDGVSYLLKKQDDKILKRLSIIPFRGCDTKRNLLSAYIPMYYSINAKISTLEQKLSEDFLVWLNELEPCEYMEKAEIIPYYEYPENSKANLNALNREIKNYIDSKNTVKSILYGLPNGLQGASSKRIFEKYMAKPTWNKDDYKEMVNIVTSKL